MNEHQDAARGIDLARRAMIARSEGDEAEVLAIINSAQTTGEAAYAAAMLLSCLWDTTVVMAKGNELKAAGALRRSAEKLNEHSVLTQVELIVRDAERGGPHA
jgi:hypothetical protein